MGQRAAFLAALVILPFLGAVALSSELVALLLVRYHLLLLMAALAVLPLVLYNVDEDEAGLSSLTPSPAVKPSRGIGPLEEVATGAVKSQKLEAKRREIQPLGHADPNREALKLNSDQRQKDAEAVANAPTPRQEALRADIASHRPRLEASHSESRSTVSSRREVLGGSSNEAPPPPPKPGVGSSKPLIRPPPRCSAEPPQVPPQSGLATPPPPVRQFSEPTRSTGTQQPLLELSKSAGALPNSSAPLADRSPTRLVRRPETLDCSPPQPPKDRERSERPARLQRASSVTMESHLQQQPDNGTVVAPIGQPLQRCEGEPSKESPPSEESKEPTRQLQRSPETKNIEKVITAPPSAEERLAAFAKALRATGSEEEEGSEERPQPTLQRCHSTASQSSQEQSWWSRLTELVGAVDDTAQGGMPVYLHVYDVSQDSGIQNLNTVLAHRLSPVKFGGVFHTGVELDGREWSFGYCDRGSGVNSHTPKQHPMHHYRETVTMPCTQKARAEVLEILRALREEYQGSSYNLVRRNCCHFSADLCERLGCGSIPSWIQRLAWIGDSVMQTSKGLEEGLRNTHLSRSEATAPALEAFADGLQSKSLQARF